MNKENMIALREEYNLHQESMKKIREEWYDELVELLFNCPFNNLVNLDTDKARVRGWLKNTENPSQDIISIILKN